MFIFMVIANHYRLPRAYGKILKLSYKFTRVIQCTCDIRATSAATNSCVLSASIALFYLDFIDFMKLLACLWEISYLSLYLSRWVNFYASIYAQNSNFSNKIKSCLLCVVHESWNLFSALIHRNIYAIEQLWVDEI